LVLKYKSYWRKSGLKGKWGDVYLRELDKHKPKNFLEIGVFCGVTARNTCDYLKYINGNDFKYIGIDLFGEKIAGEQNEIAPKFLKNQKFSNPLKNIYYNFILKENLNSLKSNENLLKKYKDNISLIAGDTNEVLRKIDLSNIDFVFLDGGHSYETVKNDLNILFKEMKGKKRIILCDDYGKESYIKEVRNAIDDFAKINNINLSIIDNRFAKILT
tara:strand:- start:50 stop:697 length:648 start_codon:yes stop_codon:yes gene_type:complete